jgi:hypothetical protein
VRVLILAVSLLLPAAVQAAWTPTHPTLDVDRSLPELSLAETEYPEFRQTLETLHTRRQMLAVHQVLAFTSSVTIIAAEVVGIVNRVSLQGRDPANGVGIPRSELEPMLGLHRGLAGASIGTYWTAAVVAWTMPSPSTRPQDKGISQWKSTRDTHIVLSILHNVFMGLVTVTGILQANVLPAEHWEPIVALHTVSGFAASGFLAAATITVGRM